MQVVTHYLKPTNLVPNSKLPVIIYRSVLPTPAAHAFEELFMANGWEPQWRYGMYPQSHYHSNTHECLGVFKGSATIRLGVSDNEDPQLGVEETLNAGDVCVLPAGTAHRSVDMRDGFQMVGSYPLGCSWDMCYEKTPVKQGLSMPPDPIGARHLEAMWE